VNATTGSTPEARCPRCGGGFHCGAQQGHCDCFSLPLDALLREALAQRYGERCLCLDCLRALARGEALLRPP
jgi:hypothetical protein